MDVILLERVHNLGQIGDVVKVKPGYARNFLLPTRKALRATEANKAKFESQRAQIEAMNLEKRSEAEGVKHKIDGLKVILIRQAGETGQLFGSVNGRDIADAITASGFTVERRQIILDRPIKTLGLHQIRVALHPEVIVGVTANVAKSTEEAEAQEKAGGFVGRGEEEAADLDELLAEVEAAVTPDAAPAADAGEPEARKAKAEPKAKGEAKAKEPKAKEPRKPRRSSRRKPRPRSRRNRRPSPRARPRAKAEEGLIARLPLEEQERPPHPTAVSICGVCQPLPQAALPALKRERVKRRPWNRPLSRVAKMPGSPAAAATWPAANNRFRLAPI
jgi:large subunit ribosomal protein L9